MVLADSNVWLALAVSKHAFHQAARIWFDRQTTAESVLFCRSTQQSFLRLLTTSALFVPYAIPPLGNKTAWAVYDKFLADKRVTWVKEPRGLDRQWRIFGSEPKPSPKLWMDAYLAAFAVTGGWQMVTADRAFEQFKGLDVVVLSKD
ncbi:MAG: PIN domain-containing protein [Planctomycetes bacterium]|nr:PIN domain-containing protein [Planctomycetota bacterium]